MLGMLLLSLHSITAAPVLVLVPAANRSFAADAYAALAQALVGRGVDARVADVSDTAPASVIDGVAGSDDDPVLVVEGLNHAQFADGRPLDGDLAADLEPAAAIAAPVATPSRLFARRAARPRRDRRVRGAPRRRHGARGLALPARALPVRLADEPGARVPAMADASIGPAAPAPDPLPPADCTCGSPWVARAQAIMSGFEASGLANAAPPRRRCVRGVSGVRPFHLPHIFNACDSNDTDCVLESTTVTMPIHSLRGDYGPVAASEVRAKLKSRQAMWQAYGLDASDDNATDATSLNTCAHINAAAIAWAKARRAKRRWRSAEAGARALGVAADAEAPIGLTGPTWIKTPPVFRRNDSGVDVTSYSFTIANVRRATCRFLLRGFHYCKLLSPLKAMEWIYVDGLPASAAPRARGGLRARVDGGTRQRVLRRRARWLDDGCYAVGDAARPLRGDAVRVPGALLSSCGGCDDLFCTF
ncbi:hypothetical protein SO694_00008248 [Aureococcus anophagefferens]|uniref:Uncharacterized protein n=1 Tax=Aureococcus anophagefferens TaxID=44056 RepID=A0ABR1GE49_AURAN